MKKLTYKEFNDTCSCPIEVSKVNGRSITRKDCGYGISFYEIRENGEVRESALSQEEAEQKATLMPSPQTPENTEGLTQHEIDLGWRLGKRIDDNTNENE